MQKVESFIAVLKVVLYKLFLNDNRFKYKYLKQQKILDLPKSSKPSIKNVKKGKTLVLKNMHEF